MIRRRLWVPVGPSQSSKTLIMVVYKNCLPKTDLFNLLCWSKRISTACFLLNFNAFSNADALRLFRFEKKHVKNRRRDHRISINKNSHQSNRYSVTGILFTCIIIHRLPNPARWCDLELLLGKHSSKLSENFWKVLSGSWNM